jgi:hypothetical protein
LKQVLTCRGAGLSGRIEGIRLLSQSLSKAVTNPVSVGTSELYWLSTDSFGFVGSVVVNEGTVIDRSPHLVNDLRDRPSPSHRQPDCAASRPAALVLSTVSKTPPLIVHAWSPELSDRHRQGTDLPPSVQG